MLPRRVYTLYNYTRPREVSACHCTQRSSFMWPRPCLLVLGTPIAKLWALKAVTTNYNSITERVIPSEISLIRSWPWNWLSSVSTGQLHLIDNIWHYQINQQSGRSWQPLNHGCAICQHNIKTSVPVSWLTTHKSIIARHSWLIAYSISRLSNC